MSAGMDGSWVLECRLQRTDPGRGLLLIVQRQLERGSVGHKNQECNRKNPRPPEKLSTTVNQHVKERGGVATAASFPTCQLLLPLAPGEAPPRQAPELWPLPQQSWE